MGNGIGGRATVRVVDVKLSSVQNRRRHVQWGREGGGNGSRPTGTATVLGERNAPTRTIPSIVAPVGALVAGTAVPGGRSAVGTTYRVARGVRRRRRRRRRLRDFSSIDRICGGTLGDVVGDDESVRNP